jgi:Spy/CpxP family protein refolding chaperone
MNFNRFSLLCAAALALTATSALAQDTKPGKGKLGQTRGGAMNPKALAKALDLTADQEKKLEPAFKKMADVRKELKDVTDPKEKRTKMAAATKDMMKAVEDVLTPEQKIKFDEMKKKMAEGAKKKKKDGGN